MEEVEKPGRGRRPTGEAKTSAQRNKAADEALVAAGGRVYRARLAPASNAALSALSARLCMSDKDALDAALIFAEKNMK